MRGGIPLPSKMKYTFKCLKINIQKYICVRVCPFLDAQTHTHTYEWLHTSASEWITSSHFFRRNISPNVNSISRCVTQIWLLWYLPLQIYYLTYTQRILFLYPRTMIISIIPNSSPAVSANCMRCNLYRKNMLGGHLLKTHLWRKMCVCRKMYKRMRAQQFFVFKIYHCNCRRKYTQKCMLRGRLLRWR